ncbi:MAG: exodeoxyribonuclease VII small subunit [Bacteroidetes bacterium]|nr:exodeoxyribonuclease VII small subunit [Bacteroidota bacterium]
MTEKKISYSEAIEELEIIVEDIENENISIDLLSEKVKRAAELIKICKEALKITDEEVNKILEELNS